METKLVDFIGKKIYVGIDVPKRQWSVTILSELIHHRTFSQPPDPSALRHYVNHHFPGTSIICAFEATKLGNWIQRSLASYGYECLVVNPADIPSTSRESQNKADPIDSRKIARTLQAGLLRRIHVPFSGHRGRPPTVPIPEEALGRSGQDKKQDQGQVPVLWGADT